MVVDAASGRDPHRQWVLLIARRHDVVGTPFTARLLEANRLIITSLSQLLIDFNINTERFAGRLRQIYFNRNHLLVPRKGLEFEK